MSKSISSINREKNNLNNGKCQLLDNNGAVLAVFDGKIEETNCQLFVIQEPNIDFYGKYDDWMDDEETLGTNLTDDNPF